jgi:hypothetical protein
MRKKNPRKITFHVLQEKKKLVFFWIFAVLKWLKCIDYDAITLSPIPPEELSNQSTCFPPELDFDTTIFPSDEDSFLHAALQLVSQLRQMHYYTDTASFSLRCEICKVALVGCLSHLPHSKNSSTVLFNWLNTLLFLCFCLGNFFGLGGRERRKISCRIDGPYSIWRIRMIKSASSHLPALPLFKFPGSRFSLFFVSLA